MLFFSYVLPQLAVSAKLLCLLMVAVCGAEPNKRPAKLFNKVSNGFVGINPYGQVFGDGNLNDERTFLTIVSLAFKTINIYSEQSQRYLCFNKRWKLVGMNEKRKRREEAMCEFEEDFNSLGYSMYRSKVNGTHSVAFNKKGKPIRGCKDGDCMNFLTVGGFNITNHMKKVSNGNPSSGVSYRKRRHRHKTRK